MAGKWKMKAGESMVEIPGLREDAMDTGADPLPGPVVPIVRHRFSNVRGVVVDTGTAGGADQSFKDECDIRIIVARAMKSGTLVDPLALARAMRVPLDGDMSAIPESFLDAHLYVQDVAKQFNDMPAKIRDRFKHDPLELLRFVADVGNRDEAIALGLIEKPAQVVVPPKGE